MTSTLRVVRDLGMYPATRAYVYRTGFEDKHKRIGLALATCMVELYSGDILLVENDPYFVHGSYWWLGLRGDDALALNESCIDLLEPLS